MKTYRALLRALAQKAVPDRPPSRWCTVRLSGGHKIRVFRNYKLEDLNGRWPVGHPPVERISRGKPVLETEQVWVEKGTRDLWTIEKLEYRENGRCIVFLRPYGCRIITRRVTEGWLRSVMYVYEDAVRYKARMSVLPTLEDRVRD